MKLRVLAFMINKYLYGIVKSLNSDSDYPSCLAKRDFYEIFCYIGFVLESKNVAELQDVNDFMVSLERTNLYFEKRDGEK